MGYPHFFENRYKYIGDAIMALFGHSASDAVNAGISMLHRLDDYNKHRVSEGFAPIKIGIGINTGKLMLGTVGGTTRMDSTVISDAVNLASRVETMTKSYGVSMLITNNTFLQLNVSEYPKYAIRNIGRVRVKGKSELVTIYEVFDADPPEVKDGKLRTSKKFLEALLNYSASKHKEATQLFAECVDKNPLDTVSQNYLKRSQEMQLRLPEGKSDFF